MYKYVCLCVCTHVYLVYRFILMHRLEGILGCCSVCHIHSTLFSETGSLAGLDWLARDPPGMHCFPSARITRTHHYFFYYYSCFCFSTNSGLYACSASHFPPALSWQSQCVNFWQRWDSRLRWSVCLSPRVQILQLMNYSRVLSYITHDLGPLVRLELNVLHHSYFRVLAEPSLQGLYMLVEGRSLKTRLL